MYRPIELLPNARPLGFCLLCLAAAQLYAATVADIIGTNDAVQCYCIGTEVRCRNLATSEDWKLFDRSTETRQLWTGSINADGTKLVCEDGRRNCVINLDGSNKQYVTSHWTTNGHFFRDSQGHDWVVYTGEEENRNQAGSTWMVRIDAASNQAIDSTRTLLVGEQYSMGLNSTGVYLGDVYGNSYLYNLSAGIKSPILTDTTSWWEPPCFYGSINPGPKPWLMYSIGPARQTIVITEWQESTNTVRIVWQYSSAAGEAFALWSNVPAIAGLVKNRRTHFVVSIAADSTGAANNTGSFLEAASGLVFADTLSTVVGRMWVGAFPRVVGTPLITPASGPIGSDSVTITIENATEVDTVRYTIDGSAPTALSTVYSGPFTLSIPAAGSLVITARAFKAPMTPSPLGHATYTRLALADPVSISPIENGLHYAYYEGFFLYPDDIAGAWAMPLAKGDVDSFAISMREREDYFALRISGYFQAAVDGKYTFSVFSDDSSQLYIDSALIVATNYMHGTTSGYAGLKAGLHQIDMLYQQGDGGKDLIVEYEAPDGAKVTMPSSVLFRPASPITLTAPAAFDTVQPGDTVTIAWQADTTVAFVLVDVASSPVSAWTRITAAAVPVGTGGAGSLTWAVPQALGQTSLHQSRIVFRVSSAAAPGVSDQTDHTLYVYDPSSVHDRADGPMRLFGVTRIPGAIVVELPYTNNHTLELVRPNGRTVARRNGRGRQVYRIPSMQLPAGLYIVRLVTERGTSSRKTILTP